MTSKFTCLIRPILSPLGSLELHRLASMPVAELLATLDTLSISERESYGVWYALACAAQGHVFVDFLNRHQTEHLTRLVAYAQWRNTSELSPQQQRYLEDLAQVLAHDDLDAA